MLAGLKRICLISLLVFLGSAANAQNLRVVTENWPPYNFFNENDQIVGSSTKIVRAVLEKAGFSYSIEVHPWARSYSIAQNNSNVLIYTILRTPFREKLFKWVRPIAPANTYHFYRLAARNDLSLKTIEDAMRHRIGVVRNNVIHQTLRQKGFVDGKNIIAVNKQVQVIKMLFAKRLDYIILQEMTATAELSDAGFSISQVHKSIFFIDAYSYMAYSNGTSDEIVNRTIAAFDELVKNGDLLVD